jgi:hypothetical protein
MIKYASSIDELVELIDKDFDSGRAVCPICESTIGTVNIYNIDIDMPELKFTQFRNPGVYCTQGHCLISFETKDKNHIKVDKLDEASADGLYSVYIEDLGLKVYEVMRLIKPYLDIDESLENRDIYWMFMKKQVRIHTKKLSKENAYSLLDQIQSLGARAKIA